MSDTSGTFSAAGGTVEGGSANVTVGANPPGAVIYTSDAAASTNGHQTNFAGFTGTSYAPGLLVPANTLTFTVNAPVAGTYTGELRYAAINGGTITVNGSNLVLPATTSWTDWEFAPFTVTLAAGPAVTVTLAGASPANTQDYVNVDRIDLLTPTATSTPPPVTTTTTPPAGSVNVSDASVHALEADSATVADDMTQLAEDESQLAKDVATEETDAAALPPE
jgi:hypothetical protein